MLRSENEKNLKKEISMAELISLQVMDKVVSNCFEMFRDFEDIENHKLYANLKKSKSIIISNSKASLLDEISESLIDKKE